MGTISGPNNIADGLVLHLDASNKLSYSGSGNTWYDLSAYSNNATFVDSPSSQILPQAYFNFDGVNDYMTIPRSSSISPVSAITQEVWFNFAPIPNTSVFIGLQYGSSYNNTYALFKESSLLYGGVNVSGSLNVIGIGVSNISGNKWVHFVHTFDGSTQKLYLDGVLQNSASVSGSIQYDSNNTRIVIGADDNGGYNSGTGAFHSGKLNQVKIYNRALSSEEITRNYISQRKRYFPEENIVTNGLVLYIDPAKYSSYTGSGNSIYDLSGFGNTGTVTNGPVFSGLTGGSLVFDGVDDYIDVTSISSISGDFTVALWFYSTAASENIYKRLIDFNYETGFWLGRYANTDTWGGGIIEPNGPYGIYLPFTNNQWHYLVSIRRGSTHILYGDGITSTVSNTVSTGTLTAVNKLSIARQPGGANQFFNGRIAQVQLYNRALSAVEVQQNYNATKSRYNI
jgi:hypothetical protein